jgi:hypothetical protein
VGTIEPAGVLPTGNIRYGRHDFRAAEPLSDTWHAPCCIVGRSPAMIQLLSQGIFWRTKVRIAILALATYLAMC